MLPRLFMYWTFALGSVGSDDDLDLAAFVLHLWRTPRSLGTGGTETGCNNNDEVTANEPQRVKM